ncbi:hypothetical protein DYY67_2325 [Candidatus Nitrosotalea sp. TS]|nr:hypothetical protein [Candidatus Nitrosotalea sp. TS]
MLRTITADEKIIDCNDAYAKNLGYTKEEIIGKHRQLITLQKKVMMSWQNQLQSGKRTAR